MPQNVSVTELNDRGAGIDGVNSDGVANDGTNTDITFVNDGNTAVAVYNGTASPITATLKSQPDRFGRGAVAATDESITVAADDCGLFPFINGEGFGILGVVTVTLSTADAAIKVLPFRIVKKT